jgi:putative ABC transport system permease protein
VNTWRILLVALRALLAHPMRSILTMLGIIIGTACVIAIVSMGQGAQNAMMANMTKLGSNLLFVRPGSARAGWVAGGTVQTLTVDDADAIRQQFALGYDSDVVDLAAETNTMQQVKYYERNVRTNILGTTPPYERVRNFPVSQGYYFTWDDVRLRRRVCLIGANVATKLFEGESPLGRQVKIKGSAYDVIGLLEEKGENWNNPDDQVIVPLTTAQKLIIGEDWLRGITIQCRTTEVMPHLMKEMERLLRSRHRVPEGEEADFTIRSQQEFLDSVRQNIAMMSALLAGIGAVSLIVGGIGIMNIMLVSVTERTREIGIRKALGATRSNIVTQFLVEAVVTSAVGGGIGVALGAFASYKIASAAGWPFILPPEVVGVAVGVSGAIGVVFGVFPAMKAAWLDPIVALRYE